jgi:hypothetical protein
MRTPFTLEDFDRAHATWGCSCGPGALAAIAGLTLDEVRPHMGDFESKGYTDPDLMYSALSRLPLVWQKSHEVHGWPKYGLVRIQWEGPWTEPSAPPEERLRFSHWIGTSRKITDKTDREIGVFDTNALANGSGWCSFHDWRNHLAPVLAKKHDRRASGGWHVTHTIEIERTQ